MADADTTQSGGTTTPVIETPAVQVPPAGQAAAPAAGLSSADVEKLLAAQRTDLETKFQTQFEALQGSLKGTVLEALQGIVTPGKVPPKKPAPGGTGQVDAAAEKPWTKDPEYVAQQTKQRELEAKQIEIEKSLETERAGRRKAEKEAQQAALFQAVVNELIDVDNPVRADAAVAKTAAELLLLRKVISQGEQDKRLYFKGQDDKGQETSVDLRTGIRQWLQSPEGLRFRPALPNGAGSSSGSAYGSLSTTDTPLTEADYFKTALLKDQKLRAQGAN